MIYNSRKTKTPDYYNEQLGDTAGDIAIAGVNMIPGVGQVVSTALAAGKFASKMVPTDEYGIAKSDFGAEMKGLLDPFSNLDVASNDWNDGNYGRAIIDIANPMMGGVRGREQKLDELAEAKKDSKTQVVGAFDNMAGVLSGHSTGVDTIIENPLVQKAGYTGPDMGDALSLGTSIAAAGKQIKDNKDILDDAQKTVNKVKNTTNKTKSIVDSGVDKAIEDVADIGEPDFRQLDLDIGKTSELFNDIKQMPIIKNKPVGLLNNPPQMKSIYNPEQSFSNNDFVYLRSRNNRYENDRFSLYR